MATQPVAYNVPGLVSTSQYDQVRLACKAVEQRSALHSVDGGLVLYGQLKQNSKRPGLKTIFIERALRAGGWWLIVGGPESIGPVQPASGSGAATLTIVQGFNLAIVVGPLRGRCDARPSRMENRSA